MSRDKDWHKLEDFIADKLKEIDIYARPSKASGGSTESYDIRTSCDLAIECKQRNTKSVTINDEVWNKICNEIPLHSAKIPVLALENKDKKRWAVLELNDFLDLYIEYYKLKFGDDNE